jgi:hypothetical protein
MNLSKNVLFTQLNGSNREIRWTFIFMQSIEFSKRFSSKQDNLYTNKNNSSTNRR